MGCCEDAWVVVGEVNGEQGWSTREGWEGIVKKGGERRRISGWEWMRKGREKGENGGRERSGVEGREMGGGWDHTHKNLGAATGDPPLSN